MPEKENTVSDGYMYKTYHKFPWSNFHFTDLALLLILGIKSD